MVSFHGFHMDLGQGQVIVDVEPVDGAQVGDSVFELQQVGAVHGHLKLAVGAQDLHLQQDQCQQLDCFNLKASFEVYKFVRRCVAFCLLSFVE